MRQLAALLVLLIGTIGPAWALDPGEELPVAAQEQQARTLFRELRCMVCQNQSIDDSDAPLAKDLRMLVRERVAAGDGDDEIRAFLVSRYGDFVLLRPPVTAGTILLWGAPGLVLVIGAIGIFLAVRRRRLPPGPGALSDAEQAQLDAITRRDT
jgi:cytochrome c-type biogenesis protein CcmH